MATRAYPPANADLLGLFAVDPRLPLAVAVDQPEALPGAPEVRSVELSYAVTAETRAVASLVSDVSHAAAGRAGPGVVIAHGGDSDGRHWFLEEAAELARLGCRVLLPATSLPPHGDAAATEQAIRTCVLIQRRALDVLVDWAGADPERLRFYGHSGGAFQGAILSAVEPRLQRLVLASFGTGTLLRLALAELPESPTRDAYLQALERFEPARYLAVPGRRHLLVQHGMHDTTVLHDEALHLYDHAAEPSEWHEYPCGHATTADPMATHDRTAFLTAD